MGVDPHDPKHNNTANQPEVTARIPEQVLKLSREGFNACWMGDEPGLNTFIDHILGSFDENASRQVQRAAFPALTRIIAIFRNDLDDRDYQAGLVKALTCLHHALFSDFDVAAVPIEDLNDLSSELLSIIQHQRFLPAKVLAGDDRTALDTARIALACFLQCREHTPEKNLPTNTTRESLNTLIRESLEAALEQTRKYKPDTELSEIDQLQLAFIRDCTAMALFFPSSDLSKPLVSLAYKSAELAEELHLFFPDADSPEEEYDCDNEYGDNDDPSGDFETVAEACFFALAFCQEGKRLLPIWKHILNRLGPDQLEWKSALVGISKVKPDEVQIYLIDLFDQITQEQDDELITETMQLMATDAILELLEHNESAGVLVKQVFDGCPAVDKKLIAARFQQALDDGDAVGIVSYGNRQKSLEEKVIWTFGLHAS